MNLCKTTTSLFDFTHESKTIKEEIQMNKEDILLKSYTTLAKDPKKNKDALQSALQQLIAINPKLGIRCWEDCIKNNFAEIEDDFGKKEFGYETMGRILVRDFESSFCRKSDFVLALDEFAKDRFLLDILYAKSPLSSYFGGTYAISYLIRKNRLQEADSILSAVYKNRTFTAYSKMWNDIIDGFKYGDIYAPSGICFTKSIKQTDDIRDFCVNWIERIKDEEEQAGAMTFAMQMF